MHFRVAWYMGVSTCIRMYDFVCKCIIIELDNIGSKKEKKSVRSDTDYGVLGSKGTRNGEGWIYRCSTISLLINVLIKYRYTGTFVRPVAFTSPPLTVSRTIRFDALVIDLSGCCPFVTSFFFTYTVLKY